jgi:GNAT superfamily N-acetyltransferase
MSHGSSSATVWWFHLPPAAAATQHIVLFASLLLVASYRLSSPPLTCHPLHSYTRVYCSPTHLACLQANGAIAEIEPLCVLDFYVHEQYQRQGVGKALFEVRDAAAAPAAGAPAADAPAAGAPAAAAELVQQLCHTVCRHVSWQQQLASCLQDNRQIQSPPQRACEKHQCCIRADPT